MSRSAVLLFASAVGLAGCGVTPPPPAVETHAVDGTVVVAGRRAANAQVVFHPTAVDDTPRRYPVGVTGADGTFRLTTLTADDGAPAGEYVVTLLWLDESIPLDCCEGIDVTRHDRLHGLYADAGKSTLRATVRPGRNEVLLVAEPGSVGWNLPRAGR